jgi:hypothetical protein
VIATAIAARLAGCDSFTAIGEWAASRPQRVLKALGCPQDKRAGLCTGPSEKTVRRVSGLIDHDLADDLLCGWVDELAAGGTLVTDPRRLARAASALNPGKEVSQSSNGLARAVRPEQREDLALADGQVDAVQDDLLPVCLSRAVRGNRDACRVLG